MIVYLNGEYVRKEESRINPYNSSHLLGKGVFETIRVFNGKANLLQYHVDRLNKSLLYFNFNPVNCNFIENVIQNLVELNNLPSARIRITISKDLILNADNLLIDIDEYRRTFPEFAKVMLYSSKVIHGDLIRMHKTTSYMFNEFVFEEAKSSNFDEAILIDEFNHVIEGTRTNVFIVKNGSIYTPSPGCGVLPGITRKFIIQHADEIDIKIYEEIVTLEEILRSDEIFLTNSINGIIKVKQLNDRIINDFYVSEKMEIFYKDKLGLG